MNLFRNKQLLSDVLAEESDANFREALLNQTLHVVKRKRRLRIARQVTYSSFMVVGLAFIGLHFLVSKTPVLKRVERPYLLVTTEPLPDAATLSTSRDHSTPVVASSPSIQLVTTTDNSPILHQLDDDELLALLPSPGLLVRRGPHAAEVVFANPDTQRSLSPN
jgi:hypothetical protein